MDRPTPDQHVVLKENPAFYLAQDAARVVDLARDSRTAGRTDDEAAFSRLAVVTYFLALEGLVNFIYEWSEVPSDRWRKWSVRKKWANVATCTSHIGRPVSNVRMFDDVGLLNRFEELRAVRNSMAHSEGLFRGLHYKDVEQELAKQSVYPTTDLPRSLRHFRSEHAETAAMIYRDMLNRLDECFDGATRHLQDGAVGIEYVTEILTESNSDSEHR